MGKPLYLGRLCVFPKYQIDTKQDFIDNNRKVSMSHSIVLGSVWVEFEGNGEEQVVGEKFRASEG